MKTILAILFMVIFLGCADRGVVRNHPNVLTGYKDGQVLEATSDLKIIDCNYLMVPLVKPGIQFATSEWVKNSGPELELKITGELHKGDRVKVEDFVIEGGWIPCQGDWYLANPMVRIQTGESKGRIVGISLVSKTDKGKSPAYETGRMLYCELDEAYFKLVGE